MGRLFAFRIARGLGVLWVVSIGTFLMISLIPGDPAVAVLGNSATPDQLEFVREQLGLDQPILQRYGDWISGFLTGDMGETAVRPIRPVSDIISSSLPITLELTLLAMLMALAIGIPLGAWAAARAGSITDSAITSSTFALLAVPVFVMGLLVVQLFVFHTDAVRWTLFSFGLVLTLLACVTTWRNRATKSWASWLLAFVPLAVGIVLWATLPTFPRQGWVPLSQGVGDNLRSAFLPSLTLALGLIPLFVQLLRSDMVQTLGQNFIVIAWAKGMPESHVIVREALRPSLFSLVTVAGLVTGSLLGGSVIVETFFGLNGLGRVTVQAIQSKDYPVVQAGVLIAAALFLLINTLVDFAYYLLEPRIRRASH